LTNGKKMPLLGLGTWQMSGSEAEQAVLRALEQGYRLIDTASMYGNEKEVGSAIRKSNIPRNEIFMTTKISPLQFMHPEAAFYSSLEKLQLDYIDLYLIHWPFLGKNRAWKVLEKLCKKGVVKSIGISNYSVKSIQGLLKFAEIAPVVNQVEFHPFYSRSKLLEYCKAKNIILEAYSPLARAKRMDNVLIKELAIKYTRTPAQIMLRWALQMGAVVIPKAISEEHLRENADIFDFEISVEDMAKMETLNENLRSGF